MKQILKEELIRISEIMGINNKVLLEQWESLVKLIGRDAAESVEKKISKDIVRELDELFAVTLFRSGTKNFVERYGVKKLVSATGSEFDAIVIKELLEKASSGKMTKAELDTFLNSIPRKLADGQELRNPLKAVLRDVPTAESELLEPVIIQSKKKSLNPTKKPKLDDDLSDMGAERAKQRFMKDYPEEFQKFEDKLDVIEPTQKMRNRFITDFEKYHDWSTSELESELIKVTKGMNERQMSWFKQILNLLNIKNWTSTGALSKSILIFCIGLGYRIVKCGIDLIACSKEIAKNLPKIGGYDDKPEENKPEENKPEENKDGKKIIGYDVDGNPIYEK